MNAVVSPTSQKSPELQRLAEAQATLDHARRNAKWKRECKSLQSASHAVQVAALAAHEAGFGWTEIGDVLGIARAMPQPSGLAVEPEPTPYRGPYRSPEPEPVPHRTHHVVSATRHRFPEKRQWVAG